MESKITEHRKKASDLSLGSSHQKIYDKAIELLKQHSPIKKHLDFGSGQGIFLSHLQQAFSDAELCGVDLMKKPEGKLEGISWLVEDLNSQLHVGSREFDTISALEIIEHLENPRHVFRELFRILKEGGILIMSTPNNESWRALISYMKRGHFVAFTDRDYPAHITALNRKDLLRAATEAGFEFQSFTYSGLGCLPGMTKWSWQGLSMGVLNGLRYSDNLFVVLKKP